MDLKAYELRMGMFAGSETSTAERYAERKGASLLTESPFGNVSIATLLDSAN